MSRLVLLPAATVFLIIDMQNDFLSPNGYCAQRGLPVRRLRRAIRPIIRLQDALPKETRVVCTRQVYAADGSDDIARVHRIGTPGLPRTRNAGPVRSGTWGAELIPELGTRGEVIVKHRFDAFYGTELEMRLRRLQITTLILGGVVSDVCVETTARSAYVREIDVVIASECTAGWTPADTRRTFTIINRQFGVCLRNDQIVHAFKKSVK